MTRETTDRIAWTCPECERTYRIPRSRPRPARCAKCAGRQKRADDDSDVEFAEVPSEPAARSTLATPPTLAAREPATQAGAAAGVERPGAALAAAFGSSEATGPTQVQIAQVLEHLESISRTMKLFRRFLLAIGIVALLNVLLVGASVIYGIWMMGSLSSLFSGDGGAGGAAGLNVNAPNGAAALPPQVQKDLRAVEDYSDALNELLQESK